MRTKLSSFGVFTRKLRVDHNETLAIMSARIGTTPSYLCMIEHGICSVPKGWINALVSVYGLSDAQRRELSKASTQQQKRISVQLDNCDDDVRRFVLDLADFVNGHKRITKKTLRKLLERFDCAEKKS